MLSKLSCFAAVAVTLFNHALHINVSAAEESFNSVAAEFDESENWSTLNDISMDYTMNDGANSDMVDVYTVDSMNDDVATEINSAAIAADASGDNDPINSHSSSSKSPPPPFTPSKWSVNLMTQLFNHPTTPRYARWRMKRQIFTASAYDAIAWQIILLELKLSFKSLKLTLKRPDLVNAYLEQLRQLGGFILRRDVFVQLDARNVSNYIYARSVQSEEFIAAIKAVSANRFDYKSIEAARSMILPLETQCMQLFEHHNNRDSICKTPTRYLGTWQRMKEHRQVRREKKRQIKQQRQYYVRV